MPETGSQKNIDSVSNCSLTVVNLIDEIDWVVGGYGHPTPQFLYSFNAFVESYVLNEALFLSFHDMMHLNLITPAFPNGRPIMSLLTKDKLLRVIVENEEHLKADVGEVIYVFDHDSEKSLDEDREWHRAYCESDVAKNIKNMITNYPINAIPEWTPLLVLGGDPTSSRKAICIFKRNVGNMMKSVLSVVSGSHFHPVLPVYSIKPQAEYYNQLSPSIDLYRRLADKYKVKLKDIQRHTGFKKIGIPPLTSILLSRCKYREELPDQLKTLRGEFRHLREAGTTHELKLEKARSIGEQFEAIEEFNEFWDKVSNKIDKKSTRLLYRAWNIVKSANPLSWVTDSLDELIKYDQDRVILSRFKGITGIWDIANSLKPAQKQYEDVERIFGVMPSSADWNVYEKYTNEIDKIVSPNFSSDQP